METKDQIIERLEKENKDLTSKLEEVVNASMGLAIRSLEGLQIMNKLKEENEELRAQVESLTIRQN